MNDVKTDLQKAFGDLPGLLRTLVFPGVAAAAGSAATASSVNSWYPKLDKPGFNPPSWVFGPAWTTLYLLMGIADHIVAQKGDGEEIQHARSIYRVQLVLNALWSVLFFGRRSPGAALIEIPFLWVAIVMTIIAFGRVSRTAALLLVPYLLWTSFAAVLNASIWRLNR